jgi:hypothetical protein
VQVEHRQGKLAGLLVPILVVAAVAAQVLQVWVELAALELLFLLTQTHIQHPHQLAVG